MSTLDAAVTSWIEVCAIDDLVLDRGVCALVEGVPVAVFRCGPDGALFAVGNVDPYTDASVMSRGIVGSTLVDGHEVRFVASPLRKHRFDLASGNALDDPTVTLGTWSVRSVGGRIQVSAMSSP